MSRRSRAMLVRPRPLFDRVQVPPPLPNPAAAAWSNGTYDFEQTAADITRLNRDGADGYKWNSAAGAAGGTMRRYPSYDQTAAQGAIVNGPWEFEQQFWFDHPAPTTLTGTNWFSLATYLMIGQVSGAWNRVVALNFLGNKLQLYHVPTAGTGGPISTVVFPTRQWVTLKTRQLADKTMQVEQDGVLLFTTAAIDVAGPAIYGLHFGSYSSDTCQDFVKADGRLALRAN